MTPVATMSDSPKTLIASYLAIRRAIGFLGFFLPVALLFWSLASGDSLLPSISDYYYSPMRDVFVGIMIALAVFFWCYRGYALQPGERISDQQAARVAAIGGTLVALAPTRPDPLPQSAPFFDECTLLQCMLGVPTAGVIHLVAAAAFFITLAVFCLVLFPRAQADTPVQRSRRRIYLGCGWTILTSLALIVGWSVMNRLWPANLLVGRAPVFWLETIAIAAFALSWTTKGHALDSLLAAGQAQTKS